MLTPSVRKIHNKKSRKVIGHTYIPQMQAYASNESQYEYRRLLQHAGDPCVERIVSQPMKVDYQFNGEWHSYTPDILVIYKDKNKLPLLDEVKPEINALKHKEKFQAIKKELARRGYEFTISSENVVNRELLNRNLKWLKHYSSCFVHESDRNMVLRTMQDYGSCAINDLVYLFPDRKSALFVIYKLLWDGNIAFDIDQELTTRSIVWISQGDAQ